jgi:hypothetical protein
MTTHTDNNNDNNSRPRKSRVTPTGTKTFRFYTDPGHGWLAVKLSDLAAVSLPLSAITTYSYQRGFTIYLEEDMDASLFLNAYRAVYGTEARIAPKHTDRSSPIRTYFHVTHSGVPVQFMK